MQCYCRYFGVEPWWRGWLCKEEATVVRRMMKEDETKSSLGRYSQRKVQRRETEQREVKFFLSSNHGQRFLLWAETKAEVPRL